jgi:hypothetical protein
MSILSRQEKKNYFIIGMIALISLLIPFVQYYFRRFDDNSIMSWDWIFRIINPASTFVALILALLTVTVVFSIFKISLPVRARNVFLFFACFISASVIWSLPEYKIDTARYFSQAKHLELYGISYFLREWGRAIPVWTDLPAIPFLYGLIFTVFGESRIFIQVFNTSLFAMTAVLTSLVGTALWNEEIGFFAGLFLLGMPYLLCQTPLMLVDVSTIFFLMLSIYLYIRVVEAGGALRSTASSAAIVVTVLCKYSTWPLLSVLPLTAIIFAIKSDGAHRKLILRRSLGVFLPALLVIITIVALKFDIVVDQIRVLKDFQRPSLDRWTESFTSAFLFQTNPIIPLAAIASIIAAALKRDLKYLIIIWLPLPIFLFQMKRIRYALPVFPLISLMASYGLMVIREQEYRKLIIACVVVTSLTITFFAYQPFLNKWSAINLKQAGAFLDSLDVAVVEVFTIPEKRYPINPAVAVPILDLFTHKKIVYQYEPGSSSPDEDVRTSRNRFSWEYRNPGYYSAVAGDTSGKRAVVLISGRQHDKVPPESDNALRGLHNLRYFTTFNPISQYITLVRIYW